MIKTSPQSLWPIRTTISISEGGRSWGRIKRVAEANNGVPSALRRRQAARHTGLRVSDALHRRYHPDDYEAWKCVAPVQKAAWERKRFEDGTWGDGIRDRFKPQAGEMVAAGHGGSSGFANTNLDLMLKTHGIHKPLVIGLIAHPCIEAAVRYSVERGYEAATVSDATADYSDWEMQAARHVNLPNDASVMITTAEIARALLSTSPSRRRRNKIKRRR